jgi:hypothetical protein
MWRFFWNNGLPARVERCVEGCTQAFFNTPTAVSSTPKIRKISKTQGM